MSLIKKIISLSLTFFMFFSVAHASPSKPAREVNPCGDSTTKKVIGGVSVGIASLGFVACYLYMRNSKLPVLIIGGDKSVRDRLISSIYASDASSNGSVAACLVNKLCFGGNYFFGLDKRVASIDNWSISQCDSGDRNAINLASRASVVVAIVNNMDSVDRLLDIFKSVPNRFGCAILTIVTANSGVSTRDIKNKEEKWRDCCRYEEHNFLTSDYVVLWNRDTGACEVVYNPALNFVNEIQVREIYEQTALPNEKYSDCRDAINRAAWDIYIGNEQVDERYAQAWKLLKK